MFFDKVPSLPPMREVRVWDQCVTWYRTYLLGIILGGTMRAQDLVVGFTRVGIHPSECLTLGHSNPFRHEEGW